MAARLTIADPSAVPLLESLGLGAYEDFVSCSVGEIISRSATSESRRLTGSAIRASDGAPGSPVRLYLKVYRYGGRNRRPAALPDKAEIEARNYRILRDLCDICTPEVLAYGRRSRRGWLTDGFILTREVLGARPFERCLPAATSLRTRAAPGETAFRRRLLHESADLVARMHAAGFCHVDLQWRNLLVAEGGPEGSRIYVLDSSRGGLLRLRLRREHGRLRDLSSLYRMARRRLRRTEQVRWLRRYLGVRRLTPMHRLLVQTIFYDRYIKDDDPA
jgi:hypothetical protein